MSDICSYGRHFKWDTKTFSSTTSAQTIFNKRKEEKFQCNSRGGKIPSKIRPFNKNQLKWDRKIELFSLSLSSLSLCVCVCVSVPLLPLFQMMIMPLSLNIMTRSSWAEHACAQMPSHFVKKNSYTILGTALLAPFLPMNVPNSHPCMCTELYVHLRLDYVSRAYQASSNTKYICNIKKYIWIIYS